MNSESTPPRRRSIRLPAYDYSQGGAYFFTICAHGRCCLFGRIVDSKMQVNELGAIIEEEWFQSSTVRRIVLDAFVVMPNHVHGIVFIDSVGATGRSPAPSSGTPPGVVELICWQLQSCGNTPDQGAESHAR